MTAKKLIAIGAIAGVGYWLYKRGAQPPVPVAVPVPTSIKTVSGQVTDLARSSLATPAATGGALAGTVFSTKRGMGSLG